MNATASRSSLVNRSDLASSSRRWRSRPFAGFCRFFHFNDTRNGTRRRMSSKPATSSAPRPSVNEHLVVTARCLLAVLKDDAYRQANRLLTWRTYKLRRNRTRESVLLVAAVVGFQLVFHGDSRAQARGAACDRTCFDGHHHDVSQGHGRSHASRSAACRQCDGVREHQANHADASQWRGVTGLKSTTNLAETETDNIVSRAAATNKDRSDRLHQHISQGHQQEDRRGQNELRRTALLQHRGHQHEWHQRSYLRHHRAPPAGG